MVELGKRVKGKSASTAYGLKKGHEGVIVARDTADDTFLVLFDNYHGGHNGGMRTTLEWAEHYNFEVLRAHECGCLWFYANELKEIEDSKEAKQ